MVTYKTSTPCHRSTFFEGQPQDRRTGKTRTQESILCSVLPKQSRVFNCVWNHPLNYISDREQLVLMQMGKLWRSKEDKLCMDYDPGFPCFASEQVWESWSPHLGVVPCRRIGFRTRSPWARYHSNDSVSQFLTFSVCGQRVNPLKVLEWALAGIRFCNFMCPVLGLQSEPPLVFPLCICTRVWKPDSCPSCGCLLCGIFPLSLFQSHVLCFWFSFCALQPHGFSSLAWAYHTAAASGPLLETPFTCSWTR